MCNCEDRPCCGCGIEEMGDRESELEMDFDPEFNDGEDFDDGDGMTDVEADADTLKSAGMGTDEDYGYAMDDYSFDSMGFYGEE